MSAARKLAVLGILVVIGCSKNLRTTDPDFRLSASELARAFSADADAARKKYYGKIIELRGTVIDVKDRGFTLNLLGSGTVARLACHANSHAEAKKIAMLAPGSIVTVRAKCGALLGNNRKFLSLFHCTPIR